MLPVAGGLYDQDPDLLVEWSLISGEVAKVRKKEMDKIKANKNSTPVKASGMNFKQVRAVPQTFH